MKNIIQAFILLSFTMIISLKIHGQEKKLQDTWISKNNDVIVIKEKGSRFNILSTLEEEEQLPLNITGDSLNFYSEYTKVGSNKHYLNKYDFFIQNLNKKKLILRPVSELSKEFFGNREEITFIRQKYNIDPSISFEKIVYHTTGCLGTCSVIDLEIDKNRNIYWDGEVLNNKDRSGQFKGQLSEALYDELINILKSTNLKSWSFPKKDGHDGAVTTLILYYNGERKYFKSMFPPTIAQQLIDFLYGLDKKVNLIRTDKKKTLER